MEPTIVTLQEKKVVGIAARTTNANELGGDGEIAKLWKRYFDQQAGDHVPHQMGDGFLLGVYTDYENDAFGEYTVLVGLEVSRIGTLPVGLVARTIPAGTYAVFTSEKGVISDVVPKVWQEIWSWSMHTDKERAFTCDFECYNGSTFDPDNTEVEIYISILTI